MAAVQLAEQGLLDLDETIRDEVLQMFSGYGIAISIEDLNKLYDSVEVDL